jgi:hypothetical protein
MDHSEIEFSPEESLRVISSMIESTKNSLMDSSHYYLLWGWAVMLASIGQYVLKSIIHYPQPYLVWLIIPVVLIIHVFLIVRDRKREKVNTFINEAGTYLWTALGFAFFSTAFLFTKIGSEYCYPFYIVLYGIGTYVSGRLIKFKPLFIGGIICFFLAIICAYLDLDSQVFVLALAILVSYLIPGYLLRAKFKKQQGDV